MSTALTVVILNIHYRGLFGNRVPNWIRKVVLDWLASLLLLKGKVDENVSNLGKKDRVSPRIVSPSVFQMLFGCST